MLEMATVVALSESVSFISVEVAFKARVDPQPLQTVAMAGSDSHSLLHKC